MGISYVNYMLSLPTYPFYSNRLNILFDTLDHLKTTNKKIHLIFKFKNIRNLNEEVEIGYLEENNNTYINQIVAKNKTTNEIMFNISRKGIIKLNDNIGTQLNRNITPVIQFFYNITENNERLNNAILLENDIDL